MSDKIQKLFSGKPTITKVTNNKVILSGKCKLCLGHGMKYSQGDFYTCKSCGGGGELEFVVVLNK